MEEKKADYTSEIEHENKKYKISIFDENDGYSAHVSLNGKPFGVPIFFGLEERMELDNMSPPEQWYDVLKNWAKTLPENKFKSWFDDYVLQTKHLVKERNNCFYRFLATCIETQIKKGLYDKFTNTE